MLEVINKSGVDQGTIIDMVSLKYDDLHNTAGGFELWCAITPENVALLQDDYIINFLDGCAGIVGYTKAQTTSEGNKCLYVKGRMLDKILADRIVWGLTEYNDYPENILDDLIDATCINPTETDRAIDLFSMDSFSVEYAETIMTQATGSEILLKAFLLANTYNFGFDVRLDYFASPVEINARIYHGTDRSASQAVVNDVVLTLKNGSISNSEFVRNVLSVKNIALVAGAGEGADRIYKTVELTEGLAGTDRKELFVDARDIMLTDADNVAYTTEEYEALLVARGLEALASYGEIVTFSVDTNDMPAYTYGVDFTKGDIVTAQDSSLEITADVIVQGVRYEYDGEKNSYTEKIILGSMQPKPIDTIVNAVVSSGRVATTSGGGGSAEESTPFEIGNRAVVTDVDGELVEDSITVTKLHYLNDVTSDIQAQINGKSATGHTHSYQAADADLLAIGGLADGLTGFLKKTGADTWILDDSSYALTTHNHNSDYLGITAKAANSSLLDGYARSTTDGGNTIAMRQSSGYLFAKIFNMTGGWDVGNVQPKYIHCSNAAGTDGYIREILFTTLANRVVTRCVRRGTITLNSSSWVSFSFSSALPGIPTVILTANTSNSGSLVGKVRSTTVSGFQAVIGGSGTTSVFNYIAIWE